MMRFYAYAPSENLPFEQAVPTPSTSLKRSPVPRPVLTRIPVYLQELERLMAEGVCVIPSHELALRCGLLSTQVRKDLTWFGDLGTRGAGYTVSALYTVLRQLLGVDRQWTVALVGMGNMGRALARHEGFRKQGFVMTGLFDSDPFNIGQIYQDMKVRCLADLPVMARTEAFELGIITEPPERAQRAADTLVEAGIRGIMNFSSGRIGVPPEVRVEYVDFLHHSYALSLQVSQNKHDCA